MIFFERICGVYAFFTFLVVSMSACSVQDTEIHLSYEPDKLKECPGKALEYHFEDILKKNSASADPRFSDLINGIYFEGDTAGFFFDSNDNSSIVTVRFINTASGASFPAERIERKKNVIWGFANLGSLLEFCIGNNIDEKIGSAEKLEINLIILAEIKYKNSIEMREKPFALKIYF